MLALSSFVAVVLSASLSDSTQLASRYSALAVSTLDAILVAILQAAVGQVEPLAFPFALEHCDGPIPATSLTNTSVRSSLAFSLAGVSSLQDLPPKWLYPMHPS